MTIQSFKNAELNNVILDLGDQDEWKNLAMTMGLDKQIQFVQQAKSPLPYPFMNQSMQNIFSTLCPTKINFMEYSKTPMPLEVLKELSFCVNEKYFTKIDIWYDDKTPDPFAIGTTTRYNASYYETEAEFKKKSWSDKKYTGYDFLSKEQAMDYATTMGWYFNDSIAQSDQYVITRWGDELRPIEELKAMALDRLKDKYMSEWSIAIKELQARMNSASETLNLFLLGEMSEWDLRKNL